MGGDGQRDQGGTGTAGGRGVAGLAWAGALALVALHLAPWRPAGLLGGWLPAELAWRMAWMGLAWLYLLWFCRAVWRDGRP